MAEAIVDFIQRLKPVGRPRGMEATPLVKTIMPTRKICKCSDGRKFPTSLLRFGPNYYSGDSSEIAHDEAWEQVLRNLPEKDIKETERDYLSAVRKVEKKARAAYAVETLDPFTDSQFRWLMIKDGCLFLQLALFILGASKELMGYHSDNHMIFGKTHEKKVVYGWIKSMFYAGNQIPLVVLIELMKQTFFQKVIRDYGKWKRPTEMLSKGILYDLLMPGSTYPWEEQPSDLLHGLQILVLGPTVSRNDSNEEDEEDEEEGQDVEAGVKLDAVRDGVDKDSKERCVSGFRKKGIHFRISNGSGIRGIQFKKCMLHAKLYLPTIPLNQDTVMLFENLKNYEECQQQNEVRSYLGLMKQLISTYEDVNHLASKGIFKARNSQYKERFLSMLKRLHIPETSTNHDHRYVLHQLRDHSNNSWKYFKRATIYIFFFTLLQTIFGVLSFLVGWKQLLRS